MPSTNSRNLTLTTVGANVTVNVTVPQTIARNRSITVTRASLQEDAGRYINLKKEENI
jgi:hypothetical protein